MLSHSQALVSSKVPRAGVASCWGKICHRECPTLGGSSKESWQPRPMGREQTQEPGGPQVGLSQSRMKMRLWGKSSWGTRRTCEPGLGRVSVRVGLSYRTNKGNNGYCVRLQHCHSYFLSEAVTETGLAMKNKNHFKHLSLLVMITLYFIIFFCLSLTQISFLSAFYWIITYTEKSTWIVSIGLGNFHKLNTSL